MTLKAEENHLHISWTIYIKQRKPAKHLHAFTTLLEKRQ